MATKKNEESKRQYVLVRTYSAGVHVGELVKRSGKEVELSDARRIWYWKGANTLNEIALRGVGPGSKVSEAVSRNVLTEAIEVIDCSAEGERILRSAKWS